jgi:hypothetical protein
MNFRYKVLKHQEIQETADKFEEGNSELFSNHICKGRMYFAGS